MANIWNKRFSDMFTLCSLPNSRQQPRSLPRCRLRRAKQLLHRWLPWVCEKSRNCFNCLSWLGLILQNLLATVPNCLRNYILYTHYLGLKWDHVTDTSLVSRGVNHELKDSVTQRSVHNFVSSVFDLIGIVAPYTGRPRLLLKDIWRLSGQQWDDPLPNEFCRRFTEWRSGLPVLGQLKMPRCCFDFTVDEVELHNFGDSSLDVFCSVAFIWAQKNACSKCQLAFIFGKARVDPMKILSSPKLELQSALLASRLKDKIETALTLSIFKVFM